MAYLCLACDLFFSWAAGSQKKESVEHWTLSFLRAEKLLLESCFQVIVGQALVETCLRAGADCLDQRITVSNLLCCYNLVNSLSPL